MSIKIDIDQWNKIRNTDKEPHIYSIAFQQVDRVGNSM